MFEKRSLDMNSFGRFGLRAGVVGVLMQALLSRVYAAPVGGGLPWEKPMALIATSLSGPVAYAIGLVGICIAGGMLLFSHELGHVGQKACHIGIVVAVLVFAAPMLASAFGVGGAVI
jgi:type IV secretory pathway VirB2 component (pilin)